MQIIIDLGDNLSFEETQVYANAVFAALATTTKTSVPTIAVKQPAKAPKSTGRAMPRKATTATKSAPAKRAKKAAVAVLDTPLRVPAFPEAKKRGRPRSVETSDMNRIATIYVANLGTGAPSKAVQRHLRVSPAYASKLIREARPLILKMAKEVGWYDRLHPSIKASA